MPKMADFLTKTQRSRLMARIKGKNTRPEMAFRDLLLLRGVRSFVMHPKKVAGKPDFYFPAAGLAVFVDGCFWHKCEKCFKKPGTNVAFWMKKFDRNRKRDRKVNIELEEAGLTVVRFWEHEIKKALGECVERVERMVEPVRKSGPKVLDLFAGVGGLSEGFVEAGCELIGHIEMDHDASMTLETRVVYHALKEKKALGDYKLYLLGKVSMKKLVEKHNLHWLKASVIQAKIAKDNHKELIARIRARLDGDPLDIVVGGPPCQAYSYIGRATDSKGMKRDSRNYLYKYYINFLRALKPKIFVFENVPGLLTANDGKYLDRMRESMKKAGYKTAYKILNAADYGVPQNRKRIILIGWNKHSTLEGYPKFSSVKRTYLVKDFLRDLPKRKPGEGVAAVKRKEKSALLKRLKIADPGLGLLLDHTCRSHTENDLRIYRIAADKLKNGERVRYNLLPASLKTHKNETGFLDRFKVVDFSKPASHTVIAHIAKDGHYYIHPDAKQNRSISVREAARLQTFPDNFKFEGSRNSAFRQIGNAVPPMLSRMIARELVKHIKDGK